MDTIRKHSKKRDAILNCLRETDAHPSAEWVYSRLKPQIQDLSLGTVYRNLALFKGTGEAISLGTVMGLNALTGGRIPISILYAPAAAAYWICRVSRCPPA